MGLLETAEGKGSMAQHLPREDASEHSDTTIWGVDKAGPF